MNEKPQTITDFRKLGKAKRGGRTAEECKGLHDARQANKPLPTATSNRFGKMAAAERSRRACRTAVPLGTVDVLSRVQDANRKLREWSLGQRAGVIDSPWEFRERGDNRNWSKKSTFQRGIVVQSYATCEDFRMCVFVLDGTTRTIHAPRGWRWDIDANGLRLRSCSDARVDYHPTASELIGDISELPRLARANWATRQANAKAAKAKAKAEAEAKAADEAAIRRAEEVGVYVCLADSIRAGNCRAGSETFARNHGLDPARHYKPAEVLAIANGQTRAVALACTAALRRTIREIAAGESQLADHRVS